jgi:hypothetical protein
MPLSLCLPKNNIRKTGMQVSRMAGYGRDDPFSLTGTSLTTDELAVS